MKLDVSKLQLGGEWLGIEIEGGLSLKVLVKPISDKERYDMSETAKKEDSRLYLEAVSLLVLDWDLMEGKTPLKCNEANKKKYLPYLVYMNLKGEKERVKAENKKEDPEDIAEITVGISILNFARDFNNFVKK